MINNLEYSKCLTEVYYILNRTQKAYMKKIPSKLISFINEHKSNDYIPDFINEKIIKKDMLQKKSRILLAFIYPNYMCDENEKKNYEQKLKENEDFFQAQLIEKYNTENLFRNKSTTKNIVKDIKQISNYIVEYKENNLFQKIFDKIKHFLRKNG